MVKYDDEQISFDKFEQLARAYHTALKEKDEIEYKNNEFISIKFSELFCHFLFLQKTKKAQYYTKTLDKIKKNIENCKKSVNFNEKTEKSLKSIYCSSVKKMITIGCEILPKVINNSNLHNEICDLIINLTSLFGECHFRY